MGSGPSKFGRQNALRVGRSRARLGIAGSRGVEGQAASKRAKGGGLRLPGHVQVELAKAGCLSESLQIGNADEPARAHDEFSASSVFRLRLTWTPITVRLPSSAKSAWSPGQATWMAQVLSLDPRPFSLPNLAKTADIRFRSAPVGTGAGEGDALTTNTDHSVGSIIPTSEGKP